MGLELGEETVEDMQLDLVLSIGGLYGDPTEIPIAQIEGKEIVSLNPLWGFKTGSVGDSDPEGPSGARSFPNHGVSGLCGGTEAKRAMQAMRRLEVMKKREEKLRMRKKGVNGVNGWPKMGTSVDGVGGGCGTQPPRKRVRKENSPVQCGRDAFDAPAVCPISGLEGRNWLRLRNQVPDEGDDLAENEKVGDDSGDQKTGLNGSTVDGSSELSGSRRSGGSSNSQSNSSAEGPIPVAANCSTASSKRKQPECTETESDDPSSKGAQAGGRGIANSKPPKPPQCRQNLDHHPPLLPLGVPRVAVMGDDGKTITGVLHKYSKTGVCIICECHWSPFSAAGFVEHAGCVNVLQPLRRITMVLSAPGQS